MREDPGLSYRLQELLNNLRQGTLRLGRLVARKVRATNMQVDGTILVDTIDEKTAAAGVTVDGVLHKDGSAIVADGGYVGSTSDTDAIQIEADGDVVLTQDLAVAGSLTVTGASYLSVATLSLPLYLLERAAALGNVASYGQIWVKNDAPNTLWYADDDGTDVQLAVTLAHGPSDHTSFANWKVIYTDGSGDQQELALGADGTVLTSTGAAGAPAFEAAAGGGGDEIVDADADTKVQTEEAGDEDKIRFDVAGTERMYIQDTAYHIVMDGRLEMTYNDSNIADAQMIRITPTVAASESWTGINIGPTLTLTGNARYVVGLFGNATVRLVNTSAQERVRGLDFAVVGQFIVAGLATFEVLHGADVTVKALAATGTLTVNEMHGVHVDLQGFLYSGALTVDVVRGVYVKSVTNSAGAPTWTLYEGLAIEDTTTATTCHLLEIGPATPYFRVVGNVTAVSRETPLYISWGTAAPAWSLKQMKTVLESTLDTAAGTKEICYL